MAAVLPTSEVSEHVDGQIVLSSGMLGAILLARAVDDPALSHRILRSCRKFYLSTLTATERQWTGDVRGVRCLGRR